MKDLLLKLIGFLVTDTAPIVVEESKTDNLISLDITTPSTEIGRIIGKNGNIIRSLRALLKLRGLKTNQQILVRLNEPQST